MGLSMLIQSEFTCKAKHTAVHARAACGTACSPELTASFTERIPRNTSPAVCLCLSSLFVSSNLVWASSIISDQRLAGYTCPVVFSIGDVLQPGLPSLDFSNKSLSYSSSSPFSLNLRSSYALSKSSDDVEGEDRTSERAFLITSAAEAGETVGGGEAVNCEAVAGD